MIRVLSLIRMYLYIKR